MIEKIEADFKVALKTKDQIRLSTLRMLKASIHNKEVELRRNLSEAEITRVINAQIKQRKESIECFEQAGRADLVKKEGAELEVLSAYLPVQFSPAELEEEVKKIISEAGATSIKDLGRVMKAAMPKLEGKADGKFVTEIVKKYLYTAT